MQRLWQFITPAFLRAMPVGVGLAWGVVISGHPYCLAIPQPQNTPNTSQPSPSPSSSPSSVPEVPTPAPTPINSESDPDLGVIRLRPVESTTPQTANPTPQLEGIPGQQTSETDPDLGTIQLRQLPPPNLPIVYLIGNASYLSTNNVFAGLDSIDDNLFSARIGIVAIPSLGPDTTALISAYGGLIRYGNQSRFDYDELRIYTAIRQRLFDQTYGEFGWGNQHLFARETGNQFYSDNSLYLTLFRRDAVGEQLFLDTIYQLRWSLAEPSNRSQIRNYLGTSLTYNFQENLDASLNYQVVLSNFTEQIRQDLYNQVTLQLSYATSPSSRIRLFTGYSFGNSSNPTIDFNSLIFGINFDVNVPLF